MELEILSLKEAVNYVPEKKGYSIRISNGFQFFLPELKESSNWVGIREYTFDDIWPRSWKEYSWLDFNSKYFEKITGTTWSKMQSEYPKMTEMSFRGLLESEGVLDRPIFFDEDKARLILNDYESVMGDVESVMIHCNRGENRAPAVGIAMNEIYGWGIKGLKDKFPNYRKFVYNILKDVAR